MKKEQLMNNLNKENEFDYRTDSVVLYNDSEKEPKYTNVSTYYNHVQDIISSDIYKNKIENEKQLMVRRRTLEIIFSQRVEFNINQKIRFMQAYLAQYNIYLSDITEQIKQTIPELFDIGIYFDMITNVVSGIDYAMSINSIVYNNLFESIRTRYTNNTDFNKELKYINTFMRLSLNEWIHMLNLLYLEANEIYYNAGTMSEEYSNSNLSQEEKEKILMEIGRPDLINVEVCEN